MDEEVKEVKDKIKELIEQVINDGYLGTSESNEWVHDEYILEQMNKKLEEIKLSFDWSNLDDLLEEMEKEGKISSAKCYRCIE